MTLEQTTIPTSIPLPGLGYSPITNLYGHQFSPQGPIANLLSQLGPFSPYAANPQFGLQGQLGSIPAQFGALQPFMGNQQLTPQIVSLLSQLGYLQPSFAGVQPFSGQPFGGQQLGLQSVILSQLAQLLPLMAASQQVGPHHMSQPWGQITPYAHLNPYQVYGGAFRPAW